MTINSGARRTGPWRESRWLIVAWALLAGLLLLPPVVSAIRYASAISESYSRAEPTVSQTDGGETADQQLPTSPTDEPQAPGSPMDYPQRMPTGYQYLIDNLAWVPLVPVVITLALLLRGRRPLLAYLVTCSGVAVYLVFLQTIGSSWQLPVILAVAAAVVGLAVDRGLRRMWGWLLVLVPTFAAPWLFQVEFLLAQGVSPATMVWQSLSGAAWAAAPAFVVGYVNTQRAAADQRHADEVAQAALTERLRVARDVHDIVGHSLSMISLQSGVALRVLEADPEQARASLTAIRDTSGSALADLRRTLGVFRSGAEAQPLAPTPDLAAIEALVEQVRAGGVPIRYRRGQLPGEVPAAVQAVAYRVVQEGLTNVVRHAGSAPTKVDVSGFGDGIRVTVADEGGSWRPIEEGGGLRGMRERVAAVGGDLLIDHDGQGLVVSARLPLRAGCGDG